jgi:UDP-N-acetylglucosamine 2-epimerase (non-hydrolysing)
LITVHRRENYGKYLFEICEAIIELANNFKDVDFICPVHPNKNGDYIKSTLSKVKNVKLIKPLQYDYMVFLMTESYFIMTDSGGIQEEAISCNKPILILYKV